MTSPDSQSMGIHAIFIETNTIFHSGNKKIPRWIMMNNELHVVFFIINTGDSFQLIYQA